MTVVYCPSTWRVIRWMKFTFVVSLFFFFFFLFLLLFLFSLPLPSFLFPLLLLKFYFELICFTGLVLEFCVVSTCMDSAVSQDTGKKGFKTCLIPTGLGMRSVGCVLDLDEPVCTPYSCFSPLLSSPLLSSLY